MTKNSGQKWKYLKKEKRLCETKSILFKFKELSVVTKCLRPKSGPLKSEILIVFKYSPLPWRKLMVKILK